MILASVAIVLHFKIDHQVYYFQFILFLILFGSLIQLARKEK